MEVFLSGQRRLRLGPALGHGAQGTVHSVDGVRDIAVKIFKTPPADLGAKLGYMASHPLPSTPGIKGISWTVAWPQELVFNDPGCQDCIGFVMRRITNKRLFFELRQDLTHKKTVDQIYCAEVAANLAAAVGEIHRASYVICDLNDRNVMVSLSDRDASIAIIDCDSWQVRDAATTFRSPYFCPEFLPPELHGKDLAQIDREPVHDLFALGELVFELLNGGHHAFATNYQGAGNVPPMAERIKAGYWPLASSPHPDFAPRVEAPRVDRLPREIQENLARCFEDGHLDPYCRPQADDWANILIANISALPPTTYPPAQLKRSKRCRRWRFLFKRSARGTSRRRWKWQKRMALAASMCCLVSGAWLWHVHPSTSHSQRPWKPRANVIQKRPPVINGTWRNGATPRLWNEIATGHRKLSTAKSR